MRLNLWTDLLLHKIFNCNYLFQELAILFYKNLAYYDFDSVWLYLINIYGSKNVRDERILKADNDKNVESILKILDLARY